MKHSQKRSQELRSELIQTEEKSKESNNKTCVLEGRLVLLFGEVWFWVQQETILSDCTILVHSHDRVAHLQSPGVHDIGHVYPSTCRLQQKRSSEANEKSKGVSS